MKLLILLTLLFLPGFVFAQRISGKVIDKETNLPIIYATVSTSKFSTVTSISGEFALNNFFHSDTIRVKCIGYRDYKIAIRDIHTDTLIVYLHQGSIMLHDVNINARHNFKQDSINLRKQFASAFNYEQPTFKDIFNTVDPYAYIVNTQNKSQNTAVDVVSVNLLSLVSLLSKKKAPETKLQQTLLQDEANNYVDQRFSKAKIKGITGMQGDSLTNFIMMYRPTIDQTKKMNDYQMVMYIKKSYAEFLKNYDPQKSLFGQ